MAGVLESYTYFLYLVTVYFPRRKLRKSGNLKPDLPILLHLCLLTRGVGSIRVSRINEGVVLLVPKVREFHRRHTVSDVSFVIRDSSISVYTKPGAKLFPNARISDHSLSTSVDWAL